MRCSYCKKRISKHVRKTHRHINIGQETPEMYFCSKKCKRKWCTDELEENKKRIVTWKVEDQIDRVSFTREIEKECVSNRDLSHFAKEITARNIRLLFKLRKRTKSKI